MSRKWKKFGEPPMRRRFVDVTFYEFDHRSASYSSTDPVSFGIYLRGTNMFIAGNEERPNLSIEQLGGIAKRAITMKFGYHLAAGRYLPIGEISSRTGDFSAWGFYEVLSPTEIGGFLLYIYLRPNQRPANVAEPEVRRRLLR